MKSLRSFARWLLLAVLIVGGTVFVFTNWSWVFAKKVRGRIVNVERVTDPSAIISSRTTDAQLHSYAILIQGQDGKLYASSSEDRKWQVAKVGYCVEALLYRYPPWDLDKANGFFNARLDEISVCPGETAPGETVPETTQEPPQPVSN